MGKATTLNKFLKSLCKYCDVLQEKMGPGGNSGDSGEYLSLTFDGII